MAAHATSPNVDTYGLTFPDEWVEIPVEAEARQTFVGEAKAKLAETEGWTKTNERRLDMSFQRYGESLEALNATFAAGYIDLWPADEVTAELAEDDSGEPLLVTANCVLGSISRNRSGDDLPLTAPTLLMAMSSDRSRASLDPRVVGATDLEPPAIVELNAGRAVRVRRHQFVRTGLGEAHGVFTETYLVPHSECGDRAAVLSFGTINVKLTQDFSALFTRIAETLHLFRNDD